MSDDLAAFLAARLDEDGRGASGCMNCGLPIRRATTKTGWTHGDRSAVRGGWQGVRCPGNITGALPWPDPARVLREVEAKRAILELAREATSLDDQVDAEFRVGLRDTVSEPYVGDRISRALAAVYRHHPDYRPEWKP